MNQFLEREQVTKIYKAGEHVRIIKTDDVYNNELGDQTGLVGKVKEANASGHVYVKFPHVAERFYYLNSEVEPAVNKPTPAPEPVEEESVYLFRKGDHVRFIAGHNEDWTGAEFTVRKDVKSKGFYTLAPLTVTKPARSGYNIGADTQVGAHKLEKFTPAPEPKVKTGDWGKVPAGYGSYSGKVFEVRKGDNRDGSVELNLVEPETGRKWVGYFPKNSVELAEKPWAPKFKLGDWVKVTGWSSNFDGNVYQVAALPVQSGGCYVLKNENGTDGFSDTYLVAAEEPHWTVTKPVGTATRIGARTLVKVEEDKWLFVYDTSSTRPSVSYRTNREAKGLFFSETPEFHTVY